MKVNIRNSLVYMCYIFSLRILLAKKVLEPKQIEELAMLHPKDTKEYIFKMIEENYILSHVSLHY